GRATQPVHPLRQERLADRRAAALDARSRPPQAVARHPCQEHRDRGQGHGRRPDRRPAGMTVDWRAPRRVHPADFEVLLPGSKSQTNRALVLAAIGDGVSSIRLPLAARDTELMASALVSLGARIDRDGDTWTVTPINPVDEAQVDCGLAGTV